VSADTVALIEKLLAASLRAWRVSGTVERGADGTLRVNTADATLVVARASAPFRWMVTTPARSRGVTSIAGLLRTLRGTLDPTYLPNRLRIAPSRLVAP
jgi:hypothetical protein